MTDNVELRKVQVDVWKTTIEVQQHFNDIEMRIRALAITVLTAILGAAALAVRDGTTLHVARVDLNLGAAILAIGIVAWLLFYFVDELWYHRLLIGAVKQGKALEEILKDDVAGIGLTSAIGDASPFTMKILFWKLEVHSTAKIRVFYFGVVALLVVAAIALQASTVKPADRNNDLKKPSAASAPQLDEALSAPA